MRSKGWICAWMCAIVMALITSMSQAAAKPRACISKSEMQEIAKSFRQFRSLANKEYCFNNSDTSGLLEGVHFMRNTQFSRTMKKSEDELFSGRFGSDWWQYFIGRIDRFSIPRNCPPGVGAYVYMFGNTMYVCPFLLSKAFSALDRASVFMHEARHIDGFPHTTCRSGPRAGIRGACDHRISDGGSYAVSVETYAQLARYGQGLHPALRAYAKASSVVYADEAFDTKVKIDRRHNFLVMNKNKKFHLMDISGHMKTQDMGSSPDLGHIVLRSQHMVLFPDDRSKKAGYVFTSNAGRLKQIPRFTEKYNSFSKSQRSEVVDYHVGAWSARVLKDRVVFACDRYSTKTEELSLRGYQAASILYLNGYDRVSSSTHLITQNGDLYEFGCRNQRAFLQRSRESLDRKFKRVHRSGGVTLGLTSTGYLYKIQNGVSSLLRTPYDGQIHEMVPLQSFEFYDQAL